MTNETDIAIDELAEDLFSDLDDELNELCGHLMEQYKINVDMMAKIIDAWHIANAKDK
jgi:hypothetical protein|tara:strand:+ start:1186 stop:1359 length:174 start_codon:yes stop_codon:yes gene_type:complete